VADSNRTIIEVRRYADDGAGGGPFYVLEVLSDVDEEEEADKIGNALYFDTKEDLRNFAKRLQDEIDALP
jgi:hypothetical protein